jgi:exopolysaccharide biosynthesis polyprenyl glycosylphosphotransferase
VSLDKPIDPVGSTARRSAVPFSPTWTQPIADATGVFAAAAIAGFHVAPWVYATLVFIVLNVDASRRLRLNPRLADELGWLLQRVALPLLIVMPLFRSDLELIAWLAPLTAALVPLSRSVAYGTARWAKTHGYLSERCAIVGAGEVGQLLANTLAEHPEFGLRPVGFLHLEADPELDLPLLGESRDVDIAVRDHDISRVLVAYTDLSDRELVTALRAAQDLPVEIHVVPRLFELGAIHKGADDLWGVPLVHLRKPAHRPAARALKRAFDLVVGSIALVVFSPFMLGAAVAVRLSGPGPILFRQKRVGVNGEPFEMLKFRTMRENDHADTAWFVSPDDLVTPVGRLLRRTSIDELPQLFNVMRGEMSIVGPRPERPHFVDQFGAEVPHYHDRHRVPGGLTGWAQIHGRSRGLDAIPERARFDNDYIERRTLWGDFVIVCRTARLVFQGDRSVSHPTPPRSDGRDPD